MATLNISMPDAMREWIDAQVAGGDYANASDYIRDLIRHDQRERDAIRLALIEGEASAADVSADAGDPATDPSDASDTSDGAEPDQDGGA